MSPQEDWRPVPGYEGRYEVSDLGCVRSLDAYHNRVRILAGRIQGSGYRTVSLWRGKKGQTVPVHRLVAEVFSRPPRAGEVCRHLNGERLDNRASNLCWGSPSENSVDTVRMGRHAWMNDAECRNGHPRTDENTGTKPDSVGRPVRYCRICRRASNARWDRKGRAA